MTHDPVITEALSDLRKRFAEWEAESGEPILVIEAVHRLLKHSNRSIKSAMHRTNPVVDVEGMVERVALAIRNADNGLDGDCVGTMLHENFRVEGECLEDTLEQLMVVCRSAARAAIEALNSQGGVK